MSSIYFLFPVHNASLARIVERHIFVKEGNRAVCISSQELNLVLFHIRWAARSFVEIQRPPVETYYMFKRIVDVGEESEFFTNPEAYYSRRINELCPESELHFTEAKRRHASLSGQPFVSSYSPQMHSLGTFSSSSLTSPFPHS